MTEYVTCDFIPYWSGGVMPQSTWTQIEALTLLAQPKMLQEL